MMFHPHTSHKMQLLDRVVYGPLKVFYNQAVDNWMISPGNVGKPITIYNIAELAVIVYFNAVVPNSITHVTRFVFFNKNVFFYD